MVERKTLTFCSESVKEESHKVCDMTDEGD